jgi:hypothetical protein
MDYIANLDLKALAKVLHGGFYGRGLEILDHLQDF